MTTARLVSLGYEGLTSAEVVSSLRAEGVTVMVDVRLTPLSRKPGLSKRRLAAALEAVGIRYMHLRALGNPKENRAGFRAGKAANRQTFERLLYTDSAMEALRQVAGLLDGETVALLCFERDHQDCHRHLIANRLRSDNASIGLLELEVQN